MEKRREPRGTTELGEKNKHIRFEFAGDYIDIEHSDDITPHQVATAINELNLLLRSRWKEAMRRGARRGAR